MTPLVRNLVIALAVSLLLNVFVAGVWAGRVVRGSRASRAPDAVPANIEMTLPMRAVWKRHNDALRPRGEAVDAARRRVRDTLVAEPFNPEAMEAALAQLRSETDNAQIALHHTLVDAARELGPEDRQRLAGSRWFLRRPHREPGGG